MTKKNAYIVDVKNKEVILLLEFLTPTEDGTTNYYYEVTYNITKDDNDIDFKNIKSIKEIYDSLQYIYNKYQEKDINNFKVNKKTTEYIFKQFKDTISIENNKRDESFINMLDEIASNNKNEIDKEYKKSKIIIKNILNDNKN